MRSSRRSKETAAKLTSGSIFSLSSASERSRTADAHSVSSTAGAALSSSWGSSGPGDTLARLEVMPYLDLKMSCISCIREVSAQRSQAPDNGTAAIHATSQALAPSSVAAHLGPGVDADLHVRGLQARIEARQPWMHRAIHRARPDHEQFQLGLQVLRQLHLRCPR